MRSKVNSIITITLFTFLIAVLMALEEFFEGELSGETAIEEVIVHLIILVILIIGMGIPAYFLINRFNKKVPWNKHLVKRLSIETIIVLLISVGLGIVFGQFIHHFIEHELPTNTVITRTILFMLITSSLIFGILEFLLISEDRNQLERKADLLEKENIISLYNVLKNQVDPHFLFNNLSVLSTLVIKDPGKASLFIKEFSNIYRYVLKLKEENLVSLKEEIDFV